MQIKTTYIAKDGKEFMNKEECVAHEKALAKNYVYYDISIYDLKKKVYTVQYKVKFDLKKEAIESNVTSYDLLDMYLATILGLKTLYCRDTKRYFNHYKIVKHDNVNKTAALGYMDITLQLYNDYYKDQDNNNNPKQAQELLRKWYKNDF